MSDNQQQQEEPTRVQAEIILSRRMFYGGCLGLPWLWICNVLYFRQYLKSLNNTNNNNNNNNRTAEEKNEIEKWVKRSTIGATIVVSVFLAWIVTFQVNKENFGSAWFVMDMTEEESSGW
eukprot:scaffold72655_cov36-Cyclotella_meneghiniana.AAC.2